MNGANMRSLYESMGPVGFCRKLAGLLTAKKLKPDDFSVREIAEATCGSGWVNRLRPQKNPAVYMRVQEAGEGVDVSAFQNIMGQIVFSKIHAGWKAVPDWTDEIFYTVKTQLDGERIPGVGQILGDGDEIRPGMPYPELGYGEHYWDTPSTTKMGMIVSVTKEAIFFDRTNLILKRAGEVGQRLKQRKKKKRLACIAGITADMGGGKTFNGNNHKWNGVSYNTYSTTANAIGINAKASSTLAADYTSLEAALLMFTDLVDPDNLEPIEIEPDTLIVMPHRKLTALRSLDGDEVRTIASAVEQITKNPYKGRFKIMSDPMLYKMIVASGVSAANAKEWWFLLESGREDGAFISMENWPLEVVQAPPNSEKEFEQDITARWKASERSVPWVQEPRKTSKMYNA